MKWLCIIFLSSTLLLANNAIGQTPIEKAFADMNSSYQKPIGDKLKDDRSQIIQHGWSSSYPDIETYLDANKDLLGATEVLLKASRDSLYTHDFTNEGFDSSIDIAFLTEYAYLVQTNAQWKLYQGDYTAATRSFLSLLELSKVFEQGPLIAQHVVAMTYSELGLSGIESLMSSVKGRTALGDLPDRLDEFILSDALFLQKVRSDVLHNRDAFKDILYQIEHPSWKPDTQKEHEICGDSGPLYQAYLEHMKNLFLAADRSITNHDQNALDQMRHNLAVSQTNINSNMIVDFFNKRWHTKSFNADLITLHILYTHVNKLPDIIQYHQDLLKRFNSLKEKGKTLKEMN